MTRTFPILLLAACVQYREVSVNFGKTGKGLDGFLCKELDGGMLLDREGADGGLQPASIVTDIVGIENGQPGCRTGQLIEWCSEPGRTCAPMSRLRTCLPISLPTGVTGVDREQVRERVREQMRTLSGKNIVGVAPDEFVILRMVATRQPCSEVEGDGDTLPTLDPTRLVGCAYSCPTLFDRADDSIYLGFETLDAFCEPGVRICAGNTLTWAP